MNQVPENVVYVTALESEGGGGTGGSSIDDSTISPDTTYSSYKIDTTYAKKTILDDSVVSTSSTYSSSKIEGEYQNKTDDTLNTTSKKIVGAINELDKEIGIKAVKGGYEKAYRNLLETPNGNIANNNKCTSNVGQVMMYLRDTKYTLYHIKNNEVLENSLQDGHTYTISFDSDNDATVEYFIFDYNDNASNIKCLVKKTVHSGAKITMPDNSYWFQVNVLKTNNITNIELVDDAFPYNDIREVVADGDFTNPNKQVKVSKVGDIAVVGEYVIYTIDESATGIYKYIDDKVGSSGSTVADVPWTQLTMGSGMSGSVSYRIKNGICYVYIDELKSSTMSANNQTITSNLPVPEKTNVWHSIVSTSPTGGTLLVNVDSTGKMTNNTGVNDTLYYGLFSYPVSES